MIDTQFASVEVGNHGSERHAFGEADIVLQLREQGDSGNGWHTLKEAFLPSFRSLTCFHICSRERFLHILLCIGIVEHSQDECAVLLNAGAQLCTLLTSWRQHHLSGSVEIVLGFNVVHIALRTVALLHNIYLQRFNIIIQTVGGVAHLHTQIQPLAALLWIFVVECLNLLKHHLAARGECAIGAREPLLHLAEPTEHITRHIQGKHGGQNDVHQVDHLLTWRHAAHRLVFSVCHAYSLELSLSLRSTPGIPPIGRYMFTVIALIIFSYTLLSCFM